MPSMAQNAARRMKQEYRNGQILVHQPKGVRWFRYPTVVYHKGLMYTHCGVLVFEDDSVVVYRDRTQEVHVAKRKERLRWVIESKRRRNGYYN